MTFARMKKGGLIAAAIATLLAGPAFAKVTVLGWPGHELQWDHDPGTRRSDVQRIYRTPDAAAARRNRPWIASA